MTIQWPYNGHTMTLQWQYNDLTMAIQWPYNGHTMTIQSYNDLIMTLQWPYNSHIMTLQWPYNDLTIAIQWPYNGHTMTILSPYNDHSMTMLWPGAGGHPGDGLHRGHCWPGRHLPARDSRLQPARHPAGGRDAGIQGDLGVLTASRLLRVIGRLPRTLIWRSCKP